MQIKFGAAKLAAGAQHYQLFFQLEGIAAPDRLISLSTSNDPCIVLFYGFKNK